MIIIQSAYYLSLAVVFIIIIQVLLLFGSMLNLSFSTIVVLYTVNLDAEIQHQGIYIMNFSNFFNGFNSHNFLHFQL